MFTNSAKHGFYAASGEAVGSAVNFNGTGLFKSTTSGFTNAQDGPITFSFWVLANELTKDNTVLAINGTDLRIIIKSNGAIRVSSQDAVDVTTVQTNLVGTSTWQHVMGSYTHNDSTAGHIFVDGVRYDWDEPTVNSGAFTFSTGDSSTVGDTIEVGGVGTDFSDIVLYNLWVDNEAYDLSDRDYKLNFYNSDEYAETVRESGIVQMDDNGQPLGLHFSIAQVNQPLLWLQGGKSVFVTNGGRDAAHSTADYWTVNELEAVGTVEAFFTTPDLTRKTLFQDGISLGNSNFQGRLYVPATSITADAAITEDSTLGQGVTFSCWYWQPLHNHVFGNLAAFSFTDGLTGENSHGSDVSFFITNDFAGTGTPKMRPAIDYSRRGTRMWETDQASPYYSSNQWNHIFMSWNHATQEAYCYMNGYQITTDGLYNNPSYSDPNVFSDWRLDTETYDSSNFDAEWQLYTWQDRQGNPQGLTGPPGAQLYVWFDNSFVDPFNNNNEMLFKFHNIQSTHGVVDVGVNGEIPLGRKPLVYHSGKYFTNDKTQGWRKGKGLWSYEFDVTTHDQGGVIYPQAISEDPNTNNPPPDLI